MIDNLSLGEIAFFVVILIIWLLAIPDAIVIHHVRKSLKKHPEPWMYSQDIPIWTPMALVRIYYQYIREYGNDWWAKAYVGAFVLNVVLFLTLTVLGCLFM